MGDNRNLILFIVITVGILLAYQFFIFEPEAERRQAEQIAAQDAAEAQGAPDLAAPPGDVAVAAMSRDDALAASDRIMIETPSLAGSLALRGARLDDLRLLRHTESVDDETPVTLLNPAGSDGAYYARDSWRSNDPDVSGLPNADTEWELIEGDRLTPETPVVLGYDSPNGIRFRRTISVDEDYLFTISDSITNDTGRALSLSRYGLVRRAEVPDDLTRNMAVFEGGIGVASGNLFERKYNSLADGNTTERSGEGGWVGITDRYWLTAVIPDQDTTFNARLATTPSGALEMIYVEQARSVAPGETITADARIFAGAKELDVLAAYQNDQGVRGLDMAINWGWLWFLTRPFVWLLNTIAGLTGGLTGAYAYGVAILSLTLLVKIILFPLANRAYASMAKMKQVQPKMKAIQERFAADKQRQQQEIMKLYQTEKINPLAGCLPILPQIPIFFALYQTLFMSLEMRHAPFFGWISDMSSEDPTNIFNLFGLIPYDPDQVAYLGWLIGNDGNGFSLGLSAWAIIMGLTMWSQQALNPPPPDPMQRRIFAFLPIVFTFVLANFPAGLVIYWAWNNALSVGQQYIIMRRHGNRTQVDKLFDRLLKRERPDGDDS